MATNTIINNSTMSIFMLPWLGHGHISPFLELSKRLAYKNILIYLCSTPINLTSIKDQITLFNSTNNAISGIKLVEIHLPSSPNLPPHLHTCKGLPPHLYATLRNALDKVRSDLSKIIRDLNPNLAILDMDLPSNSYVSSNIGNIPSALFSICSSSYNSFYLHMLTYHRVDDYPFPAIYLRDYQVKALLQLRETMPEDMQEMREHETSDYAVVPKNISFILVKTQREIDGKYMDYLSELTKRKVLPVGALIRDINLQDEDIKSDIIEWLDKKEKYSTVFITFGSEIALCKEEIMEIAHGLEISGVNFIWYLRFPKGEDEDRPVEDVLPQGFLGKVKERGRVLKGWAPQGRILRHSSLGGFVSHCGWSSVLESITSGIPIIGLPMLYDQPFNAKLIQELGVGVEIVKDSDGKFEREQVGKLVKQVIDGELGKDFRNKARQLKEEMKLSAQPALDEAFQHVVHFINNVRAND